MTTVFAAGAINGTRRVCDAVYYGSSQDGGVYFARSSVCLIALRLQCNEFVRLVSECRHRLVTYGRR